MTTLPLVLSLLAGGLQAADCDDLATIPIRYDVDWQTDVKPIINELVSPTGRCTSCHNAGDAGGGLDLSDTGFDAIYKIVNAQVIPGEPAASLLFLKVNCDQPPYGSRMPLGGGLLTLAEQALIHDWIAVGAPGEPASDPIFRDFMFRDTFESVRH